jgi:hypothetical protein
VFLKDEHGEWEYAEYYISIYIILVIFMSTQIETKPSYNSVRRL